MARPLLIAHRGASAEAPENTLRAFRRAMALGADGIELDVRVTRDGVPVVFHDAGLLRLTGRRGRIERLTRRRLGGFRVRGEPIPTLAGVLALTRRRCIVQIELKRGAAVAPVVQAVRRARAGRAVILASFEPRLVAEARRCAPRIPRILITDGAVLRGATPSRLASSLAALGASGVSLDFRKIPSRGFVRALKSRGFSVWCWTADRPHDMRRLARWGIDAILSDDPARLRSALSAPGRPPHPDR